MGAACGLGYGADFPDALQYIEPLVGGFVPKGLGILQCALFHGAYLPRVNAIPKWNSGSTLAILILNSDGFRAQPYPLDRHIS